MFILDAPASPSRQSSCFWLGEQARVRRWSLVGAILVRLVVIAGAAWIMRTCTWSSYVLGVLVLGSAVLALKPTPRPSARPGEHRMQWSWGVLSRVRRVSESHHDGALFIVKDGRRVLTRAGVCILTIALHEIIMGARFDGDVLGEQDDVHRRLGKRAGGDHAA